MAALARHLTAIVARGQVPSKSRPQAPATACISIRGGLCGAITHATAPPHVPSPTPALGAPPKTIFASWPTLPTPASAAAPAAPVFVWTLPWRKRRPRAAACPMGWWWTSPPPRAACAAPTMCLRGAQRSRARSAAQWAVAYTNRALRHAANLKRATLRVTGRGRAMGWRRWHRDWCSERIRGGLQHATARRHQTRRRTHHFMKGPQKPPGCWK